jgi:hypothetical protein
MIEKVINDIQEIEKTDMVLSLKGYYIRGYLIDLIDKVNKFDRNNIYDFIIELFDDLNENEIGEVCFRIKKYLNEIRVWYDE